MERYPGVKGVSFSVSWVGQSVRQYCPEDNGEVRLEEEEERRSERDKVGMAGGTTKNLFGLESRTRARRTYGRSIDEPVKRVKEWFLRREW